MLYAGLSALEREALADMGFGDPNLWPLEGELLRLCDGFDAYLWAIHDRPDYVRGSEAWQAMFANLQGLARDLGLTLKSNEILEGVCDGRA